MAKITIRNLLFVVQKRCLKTASKVPHPPPPLSRSIEAPNFALQFLTNSCWLPSKSAISVSQKFPIEEKNEKQLQSVIDFFKGEGFTHAHIAKLIQKRPALLHSNVETVLKPKVELLKQNGFVGQLLADLIAKSPFVLMPNVHSLMRCLELVKSYLESDEKIIFAIKRNSWLLTAATGRMQHNIDFLIKEGVPASSVSKILICQPRVILQNLGMTIYAFNAVRKLRLQPSSPMFVHAFRVLISMSESTWNKKIEVLKSFGWSEEEILSAFKRTPHMMACSEVKIRKSMDFYLNTMKLDRQTIIKNPKLLMFAIDTRVRPRCNVLNILKAKELIKKDAAYLGTLDITEEAFLKKFVLKYKDTIPGFLKIYYSGRKAEKFAGLSLSYSQQVPSE